MGKRNRDYLKNVTQVPQFSTHFIDPNVTRKLPIIFGFRNLDLDKKPFNCSTGDGDGLMYVLKTFRLFSQVVRMNLETGYHNCHPVTDDKVKKHNLHEWVNQAPNKKLHQLGRSRTSERIVGYFDSPNVNLFQVCMIDLKHSLYDD